VGKILVYSPQDCFSFYSCSYLRTEILKHFSKLQKYTKLDKIRLIELIQTIKQKITFIDDKLLPKKNLERAAELTKDVDYDDMAFIAVADYLNASLWTGDKRLIRGLLTKNYSDFKTTEDMAKLLENYEKENPWMLMS
jgi:predicted nucleic acid-binding protein